MKLYDDCVMERHYFNHFLMVTTGEVSKPALDFVHLYLISKAVVPLVTFSA